MPGTLRLFLAVLAAAVLGPTAAIALAASGGSGLTNTPVATAGSPTVTATCSGSVATKTTVTSPASTTTVPTTTAATTYSNDVASVTVATTPAIVDFTLSINGGPNTVELPLDDSVSDVQAQLIATYPTLNGDITVAGTPGQSYAVSFVGTLAGQTEQLSGFGYGGAEPVALSVVNTAPVPTTVTLPSTKTVTVPGTKTVETTPACPPALPPSSISVPKGNPFSGRAMWIWEMPDTDHGNVASIIAQAKTYGIGTVYIKSSDGTGYWSQFSKTLVTELHEAGVRVCAWQYVYGQQPLVEANLGAKAVQNGANCLVIDAESQYQGRYPAAQTYIARLRHLIGAKFPVGLAGFPYVDYHLSFPYSVFLGPNGAQYNLPQMYWADIGTTVANVFAHTYEYNEIYRRPIFPLGQLFGKLSATSIEQFNALADEYGATGVSWWDWQSAPLSYFNDVTKSTPLLVSAINAPPASVHRGNKGDLVIWAQEHLYPAGYKLTVDGVFGPQTQKAVKSLQGKHNLPQTGVIDGATWDVLDRYTPVSVTWTTKKRVTKATIARGAKLVAHSDGSGLTESVPSWMRQVRSRDELHGQLGAGSPSTAKR
jgi:Putative peptidoglycan binding domain